MLHFRYLNITKKVGMFTVCYSLEVIFKCILFKAPLLSVP